MALWRLQRLARRGEEDEHEPLGSEAAGDDAEDGPGGLPHRQQEPDTGVIPWAWLRNLGRRGRQRRSNSRRLVHGPSPS